MAIYTISNRPAAIQWETRDWVTRTLQNARNLIMLRLGEVPYDRLRGLDPEIYDRPLSDMLPGLRQEVERALAWEVDARVTGARAFRAGEDAGAPLIIEIDIETGGEA